MVFSIFAILAGLTLTSALPSHRQALVEVENPLEMPMHTTALMAGAAWDLTYSATATPTQATFATNIVVSSPTGTRDTIEL
ncbi:hypothetical protein K504DRAFT_465928 [Pleomassaria siparia CBS 279.74]|uniref:Uncharacterized protein n=1 Tax=Pleomassaria siparia CBS 279.74 TaxID=1314801 RepID=A0A6G1KDJ0_9PLEO|nr:hypothetical protein K504DRAFT_465928 [Pleomassaria siparia CBS 279.74]